VGSKENAVQSACFKFLQLRGAFVWRNQTRTFQVPGKGGRMRPMFVGTPGSPDIMGILPGGRFIGVECKQPLGPRGGDSHSRQSPEQIAWQDECEKAGGLYVLARSSLDVEKAITRLGGEEARP
jgi:hypothetical protein